MYNSKFEERGLHKIVHYYNINTVKYGSINGWNKQNISWQTLRWLISDKQSEMYNLCYNLT